MGVIDEINAIANVVKTEYPTMKINKQYVPDVPVKGELSVRVQRISSSIDTSASYVMNREYQLIYFGQTNIDLLTKIDALTQKFNSAIKIQIEGTRYLTVGSLSFSQPFKTADNVEAVIGVLVGTIRENITQPTYPAMNSVSIKINEE